MDTPERLDRSRVWIVDPLDGTKEYAQLRDDWAVHVALVIDGAPVLGAVALPSHGQVFFGVCLEGAQHGGVEGEGSRDPIRGDSEVTGTPRIAVSRSHTPAWVERFATSIAGELIGAGSAGNKVAMLLKGEADAYVHQVGLKEWDTCAPEALARSLGWHVCRLDGSEHTYNRPDPKNHEIVVCRPEARERVLAALADSGVLEDRRVS